MFKNHIRIFSLLLILCLSVSLLAVPVNAGEVDPGPDGFCIGGKVFTYTPGDPEVVEGLPPRVGLRRITLPAKHRWDDGIGLFDLTNQIWAVAGPAEIQKIQAFIEPEAADAIALGGMELALDCQKLPRESDVTLVIWDENGNQSVLMVRVINKNMTVFYGIIVLLGLLGLLLIYAICKKVKRTIRFRRYVKEMEQREANEHKEANEPEVTDVCLEELLSPESEEA